MIKIKYNCAVQQRLIPLYPQPSMPGFPAKNRSSISRVPAAFLPGTAQYVGMVVTRSKQKTATFLPGARIARPPHQPSTKIAHSASLVTAFLTETGSHSETSVTRSKQTTGAFLTETRIACHPHQLSSKITKNTTSQVVCFAVAPREKRCAILARDFRSAIPVMSPDKLRSV